MGVKPKGKIYRNQLCPCGSGLKAKYCHLDPAKQVLCERVVQEAMLVLIFKERIKQSIICEHGVAKEDKCIDCSGPQEINLEEK